MNQDLDRSGNANGASSSSPVSILSAEVEALRKRLAELEQN
jgi:hypothetical protein